MKSRVYEGTVFHHRRSPRRHRFQYDVCLLYLDLDELPELFDPYWLWSAKRRAIARFDRRKHCGNAEVELKQSVYALVAEHTGRPCEGPVRLLAHPNYFGVGFNPVSFYYCFDRADTTVQFIVAEVNNTPWGEQHCYVLDCATARLERGSWQFGFDKNFHVSPFMPMDQTYDWRFSPPETSLRVRMENFERKQPVFSAGMSLTGRPVSSSALARALVHYPFMTSKVLGAIYWQALRLWIKGTPFFSHPKHQTVSEVVE